MDTAEWTKTLKFSSGDHIGEYIVESYLGQGGTAAVYKGRPARDGAENVVAIKILNPTKLDLASEGVRLKNQLELRDHKCQYLVKPIECFSITARDINDVEFLTLVLISQYVDGRPLNPAHLPSDRVGPIVSMISEAAKYLEQKGFCHRDIKPENIIVTPNAKKVVLLDLGVMHALRQPEDETRQTGTNTNQELVTLRYSSPELISGRLTPDSSDADWRAHTLYQIGAIICEAITQRIFFEGKSGPALLAAILDINNHPMDDRPVLRCQELDIIARKCLAKNPDERHEVSWETLECRRLARKPTVVLLYCGGTIGASIDALGKELLPRRLDNESSLPGKISRRLEQDFQELAPDSPWPAIEWRFIDEEHQIFSENALPETWNEIARSVSRVLEEDWSSKYLLGLVLLHGTDTLAYTAAALQLVFPRLPCPVVITGSNQPPGDELNEEHGWHTSQSDAWTNILRSILFLIDGGHRHPLVYVAFSNTICHAMNVQKTPLNRIPLRSAAALRFLTEAFSYRNVELGRRFAFKYVEGVLVNNFFPILERAAVQPQGEPWERSHISIESVEPSSQFSSEMGFITVMPCRFSYSVDDILQLVVALPSGTISESVRRKLKDHNVIVTQWGLSPFQEDYAAASVRNLPESEIKLFRMIPESALPLLSLATARQGSVKSSIADIIKENAIVGALVGNPLNRDLQRQRAEFVRSRAAEQHDLTISEMLFPAGSRDRPAALEIDPKDRQSAEPMALFRFRHWEAMLYGLMAPFAHGGALAEQFGALFDIGFDTGVSIAFEWGLAHKPKGSEFRDNLMSEVIAAIRASGLARVRIDFQEEDKLISLRIHLRLVTSHKIYSDSWVFDSCADHRFLIQIERGLPLELSEKSGESYFANEFEKLRRANKAIRTSPESWYVLGIIKGALCWWLSEWSAEPRRGAEEVRQKVVLRLLPAKEGGHSEAQLVFPKEINREPEYQDLEE